jgi:predicted nucleic acid-binding protein
MYGQRAKLLLDTDIFVNFLRGQEEEALFFNKILVENEFYGLFSSITEIELFAVERLDQKQETAILKLLANLQRIDLDSQVAQLAGRWLAKYKKSNGLEMPDAIIAATALIHGASLVTKNTRHYAFIPGLVLTPPGVYRL